MYYCFKISNCGKTSKIICGKLFKATSFLQFLMHQFIAAVFIAAISKRYQMTKEKKHEYKLLAVANKFKPQENDGLAPTVEENCVLLSKVLTRIRKNLNVMSYTDMENTDSNSNLLIFKGKIDGRKKHPKVSKA